MPHFAGVRVRGCASAFLLGASLLGCEVSQDEEVQLGRRNAEQVDAQLPLVRDPVAT